MKPEHMTPERRALAELALGRIFRMGSRPYQEGDIAEYYRCRDIVLDAAEALPYDDRPNYARDRFRGAAGD